MSKGGAEPERPQDCGRSGDGIIDINPHMSPRSLGVGLRVPGTPAPVR
ncbi:MAG: hypothetical protein LAO09_18615 [Acidobacteriia bacterium]|nr:hypothetical protein [Terriglobia bacterium]